MVTLHNKDFREVDLPDGLVITDPPYNQDYHYSDYEDNLEDDEYLKLLSSIPEPCVIIHYQEETINVLPKAIGISCNQVATWVYNSNTGKQSRLISWWGCRPDFSKVRQPYKNPEDKRIQERIANGHEGSNLYDWWEINQVKNVGKEKTEHPCQIPEAVIERIILTTANKGDVIIDPFGGSGTTSVVAERLGYDSVYCDIDTKYHAIAKERCQVMRRMFS